jgi:acetyl-CoA carboxylase biotin carboxyl carrier protein
MTEAKDAAAQEALAKACRHIAGLVTSLPGTLQRISAQVGDVRVDIEWAPGPSQPGPEPATAAPESRAQVPAEPAGSHRICADMVGVFYAAPEPGEPPFVSLGDEVKAGQQVAIIEAMKLMTPVTCDRAGVIAGVLAESGTSVEFGTPLFAVEVT